MSVTTDQNLWAGADNIQPNNVYTGYDFFLRAISLAMFPRWNIFNNVGGSENWTPNMGQTMKVQNLQPTPVSRTTFYPESLQLPAKKDVFEMKEWTEEASLQHHKFRSPKFHFLSDFQQFIKSRLGPHAKDIARQIGVANDIFVRTKLFDHCPNYVVVGNEAKLGEAPTGAGNAARDAAGSKSAAWLEAEINSAATIKPLTLKAVNYIGSVLVDGLKAPHYEGAAFNSKPMNQRLAGRYLLLTSHATWMSFASDPDRKELFGDDKDTYSPMFKGPLAQNMITVGMDCYPLRALSTTGAFVVPEIHEADSNLTVPNPYHSYNGTVANGFADCEISLALGADTFNSIRIGPPPMDFNAAKGKDVLTSMNWNGMVRMTDKFLNRTGTIGGGDLEYEFNGEGELRMLMAYLVMGFLPKLLRNAIVIIHKRAQPVVA